MTSELKFSVAECKVIKPFDLESFGKVATLEIGDVCTVSNLDHPTDIKLWYHAGSWQIDPKYFDIDNPVRIIKKIKDKLLFK